MTSSPAQKHLIVVTGPTAVGKTALCIQLALRLHTEIVSADSRQCYQGMAIGTAQPTAEEMQIIPHHLINFLPIQTTYSAGRYAQDAHKILATLFAKYNYVLMTGGTGLYIRAVCQGLDTMPSIAPAIRTTLNHRLQKEGLSALVAELALLDPAYYQVIDPLNPHRVIRALEVCIATGQPYSIFRKRQPKGQPFAVVKIGLRIERPMLYQQINRRAEHMLSQGLLQEAMTLYPYRHHHALQTIGYRELFGYLEGHYDQKEAIRLLKRNTRNYAKRQLTWLNQDRDLRWFHPSEEHAILSYIQQMTQEYFK